MAFLLIFIGVCLIVFGFVWTICEGLSGCFCFLGGCLLLVIGFSIGFAAGYEEISTSMYQEVARWNVASEEEKRDGRIDYYEYEKIKKRFQRRELERARTEAIEGRMERSE